LPPTRAVARPVLTAMAARGLTSSRRPPLITVTTVGADRYASARGDYIDGEVIDVTDVADVPALDPPTLPGAHA